MSENQDGALPRAQPLPKRNVPPRVSRPRPAQPGNEEAGAVLNLGEFQDVDTLTLSEASLVINALIAKRRMDHRNVNETEYVLLYCA
jgi:DNA-directed RNA polymerase II subunit RPB4